MGVVKFGVINGAGPHPFGGSGGAVVFNVGVSRMGCAAQCHPHKERAEFIILNQGPCPEPMNAIVIEGARPRGQIIVVDGQARPEVIYQHPAQAPLVENEYQRATPRDPGLPTAAQAAQTGQPYNAEQAYNDAAFLNEVNKKTHLTFKTDQGGYAKANTQGFESLFRKDDLAKTEREATSRNDAGFVQELLGGPNSNIQFEGNRVVLRGPLGPMESELYRQNADAIGEAVRGHYDNAKNMYQAILNNGGKTYRDFGADPAAANMASVDSNAPASQDPSAQQPAAPAPAKPAPAAAAPAPDPHLFDALIQKDKVGEAQEILDKYFGKNLKIDGIDTLKNGGVSKTDAALSAVLGHNVTSTSMTQADLNELEIKAKLSNEDKASILKDVGQKLHLSDVKITDSAYTTGQSASSAGAALGGAWATAKDTVEHPVNAAKNAFKALQDKMQSAHDNAATGKPISATPDNGGTINDGVYHTSDGNGPTTKNLAFTADDKAKLANINMTNVEGAASTSNVTKAPPKSEVVYNTI